LTRGEVEAVSAGGFVEACTRFPGGGTLRYRVSSVDGIESVVSRFHLNCVFVDIPREWSRDWAQDQRVGFETQQALEPQLGSLRIVVEKDFRCLAPREGEDDSDAFPNPSPGEC